MDRINVPVLFVIFNRPGNTQRVFEQIRKAQPRELYVAADGPRPGKAGEEKICDEVRSIVNKVDWDCKVFKLFRDTNLGCGKAVSSAISWFFSQVEQGIILEDDCMPDTSFFYYCDKLLNFYKADERVLHINGFSPLVRDKIFGNKIIDDDAIFFSRFQNIWGWATWRRAWNLYSFDVKNIKMENILHSEIYSNEFKEKALDLYNRMANEATYIDTWDFQWALTVWSYHGLAIVPLKNLVQNLGFGPESTHSKHNLFFDVAKAKTINVAALNTPADIENYIIPEFEENIFNYSTSSKRNLLHMAANFGKYLKLKLKRYS